MWLIIEYNYDNCRKMPLRKINEQKRIAYIFPPLDVSGARYVILFIYIVRSSLKILSARNYIKWWRAPLFNGWEIYP